MVIKTGREWLLVESFKLQDHRQRNCVIRSMRVESAELSDHNVSTSERLLRIPEYRDLSDKMVQHGGDTCRLTYIVYTGYVVALEANVVI